MAETCITCLSTQNTIDMTEKEWMVFDMLLHPLSKQYSSIRNNHLAKICVNCKCSLHYVEKFRTAALKNFLLLMNVWSNISKGSTSVYTHNIRNEEIQYDKKDGLIEISITPESNVLGDSKEKTNIVGGLTGDTNMLHNFKEETYNVDALIGNTHSMDNLKNETNTADPLSGETNIMDNLKEEPNIVDDITEETNAVDEERQNNMPSFYNGQTANYYNLWPNMNMNNVISTNCVYSNKPGETQHTIHDDMNSMLQMPSKLPSIPPKVSPTPNKFIKILPKVTPNQMFCQTENVKYPILSILPLQTSPKMMLKKGHSSKMCNNQCPLHIESPVNCTECFKQCKNGHCLKRHMSVSHGKKKYCDVCEKHFRPSGFSRHLKLHNSPDDTRAKKEQKYCELCEKWISLKSYKAHIETTLKHMSKDDFKYTCDYCSEKFATKTVLRDHILVVHLKLNPYKCPHCPMEFKNHPNRGRHVRLVHEKRAYEKKYICAVCGKGWETSTLLRKHMPTHTGERPYKCGKCDATFGHKAALYLHNRYKHEKKKCPPKKKKNATQTTK